MARDKKSLFGWLTGGTDAENDYSFDDLETGSGALPSRSRAPAEKRAAAPMQEPAEEPVDGESQEVWFVFDKRLYQLNSYERLEPLLRDIVNTWEFF